MRDATTASVLIQVKAGAFKLLYYLYCSKQCKKGHILQKEIDPCFVKS